MGVEKTFSITVKATDIEEINGKNYRRLDIVHGDGKSFFDDGGEKKDVYSDKFLGAAVRKIFYKLLKQYKLGIDDIKTLCRGEKDKEKIVFYKSEQRKSGEEDNYVAVPNVVSEETYYFAAAKTPTLKLIVDNEGREWKAPDGTTLAIDNNIDNNLKIANLAMFCQLVIPDAEQADCKILIDYEEKTESDQGKGKQSKEGGEMDSLFGNRRQVILTGAPGTGKTYKIRKFVKEQCGEPKPDFPDLQRSMFVQFHSSYDYSDFVEGLRPVQLKLQGQGVEQDRYEVAFVRVDGVFKRFCRQIVEYNLAVLKKEAKLVDDKIALLRKACDLPANASDDAKKAKDDKDAIRAKIMETKFYFVIDEINRADLGRVFGELMFGLEESYRGVENSFPTQYANLTTYNVDQEHPEENGYYGKEADGGNGKEDVFEWGFFIPENLYIIGTMNDIDRSVESIDFALRRRFKWVEVKANEVMKEVLSSINEGRKNSESGKKDMTADELKELVNRAQKLNDVISAPASENGGEQFGLNEAFHIGPAYFKDYDPTKPNVTWETSVEPILREYVRGRNSDKVEKFIAACKTAFGIKDEEATGKPKKPQSNKTAAKGASTSDGIPGGSNAGETGEQA